MFEPVPIRLRRGEAVFHHPLAVHGSLENRSGQTKYHYQRTTAQSSGPTGGAGRPSSTSSLTVQGDFLLATGALIPAVQECKRRPPAGRRARSAKWPEDPGERTAVDAYQGHYSSSVLLGSVFPPGAQPRRQLVAAFVSKYIFSPVVNVPGLNEFIDLTNGKAGTHHQPVPDHVPLIEGP